MRRQPVVLPAHLGARFGAGFPLDLEQALREVLEVGLDAPGRIPWGRLVHQLHDLVARHASPRARMALAYCLTHDDARKALAQLGGERLENSGEK